MGEFFYNRKIVQNILQYRRRKRYEFIMSKVTQIPMMNVIDIGCGPDGRSFEDYMPADYQIVGIDIINPALVMMSHPNFTYIQQSASDLSQFKDKEFDLAVSIGMLEHICDHDVLLRMTSEMMRVARQVIVIVPWKYCLVEPHFKFPFFPLYSDKTQNMLAVFLNLHSLSSKVRNDSAYISKNYQWLSNNEWLEIFPQSDIHIFPTLETIAIVRK